jgi:hypothetical protein
VVLAYPTSARRWTSHPVADRRDPFPVRDYTRLCTDRPKAAKLPPINLRHYAVSRMRALRVAADIVAAWHGHSERMTQPVYGCVSDDRLAAASLVLSNAVGQR